MNIMGFITQNLLNRMPDNVSVLLSPTQLTAVMLAVYSMLNSKVTFQDVTLITLEIGWEMGIGKIEMT